MATAPLQRWQQCQHNDGKDASATRERMPAQQCNNASALRATTPVQQQQKCQHDKGDDASATKAKKPAQWQRHHFNYGNNSYATEWVTTPVHTSATMTTMPAQQWQQRQCNEGNNASITATKAPAQ
jgi:hypothetical protein